MFPSGTAGSAKRRHSGEPNEIGRLAQLVVRNHGHYVIRRGDGLGPLERIEKQRCRIRSHLHARHGNGIPRCHLISAAWGPGENAVQGTVNPDKYVVFKGLLADEKRCPIIERSLGSKEKKLIYGAGGSARTRNVNTTRTERETHVLKDEERQRACR
jgi:hypothetical protein